MPDGKTETGRSVTYGFKKDIDHTPHNLFVEMDELEGEMWVEKARWIKYEEDLEAEAGRWGKPHVSSLTFRSLLNVRFVGVYVGRGKCRSGVSTGGGGGSSKGFSLA